MVETICDEELTLDLGTTNSPQNLNCNGLSMLHIGAFEDVGVLATAHLPNDLIGFLATPLNLGVLKVKFRYGLSQVDLSVILCLLGL